MKLSVRHTFFIVNFLLLIAAYPHTSYACCQRDFDSIQRAWEESKAREEPSESGGRSALGDLWGTAEDTGELLGPGFNAGDTIAEAGRRLSGVTRAESRRLVRASVDGKLGDAAKALRENAHAAGEVFERAGDAGALLDNLGNASQAAGALMEGDAVGVAQTGANAALSGAAASGGGAVGGKAGVVVGGMLGGPPGALAGGAIGTTVGAVAGSIAYDAYGRPVVDQTAENASRNVEEWEARERNRLARIRADLFTVGIRDVDPSTIPEDLAEDLREWAEQERERRARGEPPSVEPPVMPPIVLSDEPFQPPVLPPVEAPAGPAVTPPEEPPEEPPQGEGYDPFADPNMGRPRPSRTQLTRAREAGSAAWLPEAGEDDGAGTSAGTGEVGQEIGCEYSGTCGDESSGETESGDVASATSEDETGPAPGDWGDEFDPDKAIPRSPRSAEPPVGSDREATTPTITSRGTTQQPPQTTQQPPKDQGTRVPPPQPAPPTPQPAQPRQVESCCALTGDIRLPEKKYIVSTSTQEVPKGGVRASPDCTSLTSVSVVSIDEKFANEAANKLRSTGSKQVQIFGSESAALSRAGALCSKPVWDNMARPSRKPEVEQQCAQLKSWWKLARCDDVLPRDPNDPRYSTPSGASGGAYAACKRSLASKTQCESAGQW